LLEELVSEDASAAQDERFEQENKSCVWILKGAEKAVF
jgi:hypothetical protein